MDNKWFDVAIIPVVIVYVAVFTYFFFIKVNRRKRLDKLHSAFNLLTNGFQKNTLVDDDDIILIFENAKIGLNLEGDPMPLFEFLEEYIVYLRKGEKLESNLFNEINERLKKIIKEERREQPFEGVNDHERRLLTSIEESANRGETASIAYNLTELSRVLISNQKQLERTVKMNKFTKPLSVIGLVLTILSVGYSYFLSSKEEQRIQETTEVLKKLEKHLSTTKDTEIIIPNQ
ncbi:hypothetical protein [Porphyromonas gulae]|uniref:hypothetical protein n=1 Tax=Porphyromonas gulae TaxID=111105 RepID=UPI00051D6F22|nr:hypothetical protein [Porphyromonas gulae]KGL48898.1 hypothetical protein HQ49_03635 [Porphyromonas gulae]